MTRVALGVHVHAQPERLRATLEAVARHTGVEHELVLLPDGADEEVRRELAALAGVRQLSDEGARGAAACLNRLARETAEEVLVLLESGAVVGPRWLDHLLAALDSSPRAGLAGPSTNRSWNEQGVFPAAGGSLAEVARTAAEAERRFGALRRTLAPLYSLGDFCYAVRRQALAAAGGADEGYGLGPCWEMDLNARAARAGYDGLWACAAYVWRAPFTPRREREEAARFEASKRRYQDRFCGARLRGERRDYRPHCRGDACPNFAPRMPRGSPATAAAADPRLPLVTCIMPTRDRRAFVPQAIRCFEAQDYPRLELVVVDDGDDPIADLLPADPRLVYVRPDARLSVGAKRNLACERARGEIVVHWDDDDWYPASRVRVQAAALAERGADLCGTSVLYYYDRARERAWRYRYAGGPAVWVAGNTLAYRREAWRSHPFADVQVGEDARFVWAMAPARVVDLQDPGLCVAAVHPGNVSAKDTEGAFWTYEPVERIREVLAAGTPAVPPAPPRPLVSCIMPTCDRRTFIPLALAAFHAQSYPNRELVVVDDGGDAVGDALRAEPGVRYLRVARRLSIGAKRNLACAEAKGEIVAHWDDDDWYAADRLERQVAPILRGEAEITGLESFVLELPERRFWTTAPRLHRAMFVGDVHGGTLVFRRAIWTSGVRYPEVDLAEDAAFLQQATARGQRLLRLDNRGSFVYLRHGKNAWRFAPGTFLDPAGWSQAPPPPAFSPACLDAYAAAAGAGGR